MQNEGTTPWAPRGLKTAGMVAAGVAVLIVGIGFWTRASDASEAQHWSDARAVPTVHLVPVKASTARDPLTLPGTMEAWNAAKIYARVGGYLRNWDRDIGATVATGTPLGIVDTPELDQQIVQARADLAKARASAGLAKSTAARWNDLLSTNSVSHQEADEKNGELAASNASVQSASANLGRLLAQKQFATLRAPFAGVVTLRSADVGDLVGPGASTQQPLFAVADVHRIRLYVSVPQAYSAAMRPGLRATLTVPDYPGRIFTAELIGTSGVINPQTGTLQIQLVADNPGGLLKPGGYAQVQIAAPSPGATIAIPSSALVFRAQGIRVATIGPDSRVRMLPIKLGRDLGGTIEVTSGLGPNQRIIDSPPDSIADGELVRVADTAHG
ncbi:efflux RND transporter periplasmic adaptor subunit [Sphingomonas sp. MMS24-J13]|uniref:efflux RND transporter periplasmic adaptor subunit n=1 Tax=Sphingomonas sp. MMS24-J13 TaxID=3238686 RepID=UPI00384CB645